jgi:hypothetical protein
VRAMSTGGVRAVGHWPALGSLIGQSRV